VLLINKCLFLQAFISLSTQSVSFRIHPRKVRRSIQMHSNILYSVKWIMTLFLIFIVLRQQNHELHGLNNCETYFRSLIIQYKEKETTELVGPNRQLRCSLKLTFFCQQQQTTQGFSHEPLKLTSK